MVHVTRRSRSVSRGRTSVRSTSRARSRSNVIHKGRTLPVRKMSRSSSRARSRSARSVNSSRTDQITNFDDLHSGISELSMKVVLNKNFVKGAKGGNVCYSQNYAGVCGNGTITGEQSITSFGIGTCPQWLTSTGATYDPIGSSHTGTFTRFFDLNPNVNITGSGLYAAATVPLDDRFAFIRTESQLAIANLGNSSAYVDIYVLRCKRDTPNTPQVDWQIGYTADALGIAVVAPALTTPAGVAGSGAPFIVGSKPSDVKHFNDFWQIKKVHHVNLAAGANERIKFDLVLNTLGKEEDIQALSTTGILYPKGSIAFLFVSSGQLGATAINASPNYVPTQIGILFNNKFHFKPVFGNAARLSNKYMVTDLGRNDTLNIVGVNDAIGGPLYA